MCANLAALLLMAWTRLFAFLQITASLKLSELKTMWALVSVLVSLLVLGGRWDSSVGRQTIAFRQQLWLPHSWRGRKSQAT
eukprot:scaffold95298_cov42-Prasinocladus_malaysianus.AAC.1